MDIIVSNLAFCNSFLLDCINSTNFCLNCASILDFIPAKLKNKDRVTFGLHVELEDLDTGETVTYQLVGPDESEPENGMISITSPIGRALIGKQVDDDVVVQAPGGVREFVVLNIS